MASRTHRSNKAAQSQLSPDVPAIAILCFACVAWLAAGGNATIDAATYDDAWLIARATDFIEDRFRKLNARRNLEVFSDPLKLSDDKPVVVDEGGRHDRRLIEFTVKNSAGKVVPRKIEVSIVTKFPSTPKEPLRDQDVYFLHHHVDETIPPLEVDAIRRVASTLVKTLPLTLASVDENDRVHMRRVDYCPLTDIARHGEGLYFLRFTTLSHPDSDDCQVGFRKPQGQWRPKYMAFPPASMLEDPTFIQDVAISDKPIRPYDPDVIVLGLIHPTDVRDILSVARRIEGLRGKIRMLARVSQQGGVSLSAGDLVNVEPTTQFILESKNNTIRPIAKIGITSLVLSSRTAKGFPPLGPQPTQEETVEWTKRTHVMCNIDPHDLEVVIRFLLRLRQPMGEFGTITLSPFRTNDSVTAVIFLKHNPVIGKSIHLEQLDADRWRITGVGTAFH